MSDEAWIEQSLARLEELESHKSYLESRGDYHRLAEVQTEITALYEALEAVAAEGEGADEDDDPGHVEPTVFGGFPSPSRLSPEVQPSVPLVATDFDAHAGTSDPSGMSMGGFGNPMIEAPGSFGMDTDDDILSGAKPQRSRTPLFAAAAVLIAGIGAGGYLMASRAAPESTTAAAAVAPVAHEASPSEPKVITASAVPEDTQEPQAAQGAEVDRTPSALEDVAEGEEADEEADEEEVEQPRKKPRKKRSSSSRKRGKSKSKSKSKSRSKSSSSKKKRRSKKKDDPRKVKVSNSDDPLGGL